MTLRDRQAQAARKLILGSALELFSKGGYVATTMDEIASEAGVARRTIYNQFGSKAALLMAIVEDRVRGDEERSQEADQAVILAEEDAVEMIRGFVAAQLGVVRRALPIVSLILEASAVDGEVAKQYDRMEERRLEAQAFFLEALAAKGFLRSDAPMDYLQRGFWMLASPRMAITATEAGWTMDDYGRWLEDTVVGFLLER